MQSQMKWGRRHRWREKSVKMRGREEVGGADYPLKQTVSLSRQREERGRGAYPHILKEAPHPGRLIPYLQPPTPKGRPTGIKRARKRAKTHSPTKFRSANTPSRPLLFWCGEIENDSSTLLCAGTATPN